MLGIEIINICNYNCYFCGSQYVNKHKILSNDVFFKIIDDAKKIGIDELDLTPIDGEVFIDPEFIEKLNYVLPDFSVSFYTNFSKCNEAVQDKLKKLTEKYQGKLDIRISDYGDGCLEDFITLTRKTENDWNIYRNNLEYAKKINLPIEISYRGINYDFYNGVDIIDKEEFTKNIREKNKTRTGVCSLQFIPRLNMNGNMVYCLCGESELTVDTELLLGNIYKTSLEDVYFSKKRLEIFTNQTKNIYNESCSNCDIFENKTGTIKNYKVYKEIKDRHGI